jgi:phage tail-like protein
MFKHPPVGFHFSVTFTGLVAAMPGIPDVGFQEVTGLESSVTTEDFKEGGENRFSHKLPTTATFTNITLKRGLLNHSQLITWFKSGIESFVFLPSDLLITLLNEDHVPLHAWNVVNAYPVKWSVTGLNAQEPQLMIEQVELAYQYFRAVPII